MLSQSTAESAAAASDTPNSNVTLFNSIYQLAISKNEVGLSNIVKEGLSLDICHNIYTPAMLLAKEGKHEAVDFLLNRFNINRNLVACGYAMGGYDKQVKQQISKHARYEDTACGYAMGGYEVMRIKSVFNTDTLTHQITLTVIRGYMMMGHVIFANELLNSDSSVWEKQRYLNNAAWGSAFAGNVAEVNRLVALGADKTFVISGFAYGGHFQLVNQMLSQLDNPEAYSSDAILAYAMTCNVEQVNLLLQRYPQHKRSAICGYATAGFVKAANELLLRMSVDDAANCRDDLIEYYARAYNVGQVNALIALGGGGSKKRAVEGYQIEGHLGDAIHTIVATSDMELRGLIADKSEKFQVNSKPAGLLIAKAAKLNMVMEAYNIRHYGQAQSLLLQGTREWLLQGSQLVANEKFPLEVFFQISAFIVGLSISDTAELIKVLHRRLFVTSVETSFKKFQLGLFSQEKYLEEHNNAFDRYNKRVIGCAQIPAPEQRQLRNTRS